jgi:hypothetical protein
MALANSNLPWLLSIGTDRTENIVLLYPNIEAVSVGDSVIVVLRTCRIAAAVVSSVILPSFPS